MTKRKREKEEECGKDNDDRKPLRNIRLADRNRGKRNQIMFHSHKKIRQE